MTTVTTRIWHIHNLPFSTLGQVARAYECENYDDAVDLYRVEFGIRETTVGHLVGKNPVAYCPACR